MVLICQVQKLARRPVCKSIVGTRKAVGNEVRSSQRLTFTERCLVPGKV